MSLRSGKLPFLAAKMSFFTIRDPSHVVPLGAKAVSPVVYRVEQRFSWIIHFLTSQKTTDALQEAYTLDFHRIQNPFGEHPPMTDCIEPQLHFSFYPKQKLLLCFDGGQITSDAGLLLLRQFDQRHGLTAALAEGLADERRAASVDHQLSALLRQRIYQIVAGYEDGNDANRLRHDATFQLLAERSPGELLASQPTLSRWENRFTERDWVAMNRYLCHGFAQLCRARVVAAGEIVLDIDSTADPTYGQQEFSFYNGAYDRRVYHPLLVFERHTGYLLAVGGVGGGIDVQHDLA